MGDIRDLDSTAVLDSDTRADLNIISTVSSVVYSIDSAKVAFSRVITKDVRRLLYGRFWRSGHPDRDWLWHVCTYALTCQFQRSAIRLVSPMWNKHIV